MAPADPVQPIRGPLPPFFFLLALLLEVTLSIAIPIAVIIPRPWHWTGVAFIAAGLTIAGLAAGQFRCVNTPLRPSELPTALVTAGPFRFSRNPIYLSMSAMLVGICIILRTLSPWIIPVIFVWIITGRFVRPEERNLSALFGDRYAQYQRDVRRWL
jgi:protein-S-isoprenylcysteine O-methyltransferase Ste14